MHRPKAQAHKQQPQPQPQHKQQNKRKNQTKPTASIQSPIRSTTTMHVTSKTKKITLSSQLHSDMNIKQQDIDKISIVHRNINVLDRICNSIGHHQYRMQKIRYLYLSNNFIQNIQHIQQFPNLQTLSLTYNQITKLTNIRYLSSLPKLSYLGMEGNPVTKSPFYLPYVMGVTANHCMLRKVDKITLTSGELEYIRIWDVYEDNMGEIIRNYFRLVYLVQLWKKLSFHRVINIAYNNVTGGYGEYNIRTVQSQIQKHIDIYTKESQQQIKHLPTKYIMKIQDMLYEDITRISSRKQLQAQNQSHQQQHYQSQQKQKQKQKQQQQQQQQQHLWECKYGQHQNMNQLRLQMQLDMQVPLSEQQISIRQSNQYQSMNMNMNMGMDMQMDMQMGMGMPKCIHNTNKLSILQKYFSSIYQLLHKQKYKIQQIQQKIYNKYAQPQPNTYYPSPPQQQQQQQQQQLQQQLQSSHNQFLQPLPNRKYTHQHQHQQHKQYCRYRWVLDMNLSQQQRTDIHRTQQLLQHSLYSNCNKSKQQMYYEWKLIARTFIGLKKYYSYTNKIKYSSITLTRIFNNNITNKYICALNRIKSMKNVSIINSMVWTINNKYMGIGWKCFVDGVQWCKVNRQCQRKLQLQIQVQVQDQSNVYKYKQILHNRKILRKIMKQWKAITHNKKIYKQNIKLTQQIINYQLRQQKLTNKLQLLQRLLQITQNKLSQKQNIQNNPKWLLQQLQKDCQTVQTIPSSPQSLIRRNRIDHHGKSKQRQCQLDKQNNQNRNNLLVQRKFNSSRKYLRIDKCTN